ncbi:hypothetical protein [Virgibacillus sp. LDC-1]|uniref:esterase/lipase family protein n=1 Tax=Virgibacillus sp. LDC-1 TaxID=3039856 RepID=UPI0024DE69D4|nr:hypothetical protein [Virgibacillus sp. LDC-1]
MKRVQFIFFTSLLMVLLFGITNYSVKADAVTDVAKHAPALPFLVDSNEEETITGKVGNGNAETPGEWYKGDVPPNLIPNAPVLLFVPGLNNVAQIFWENNDMFQTAFDAGYQTAFIQLYDAGGASADMWDNGALLAEKIVEISNHFGGKPITIVAYSKGGVDTQTALTYYGAWQYVQNVITLSSPHHGSQLADLAYSSWSSWLADLIGAKGDGTYAMQTGNMANFRSVIDQEPKAYYNDYYTLGGTSWGSVFSSTWYGGVYLSQYGSNDGVVTTASSRLPGGEQLAIGEWTHSTIRTGLTFPVFEGALIDPQPNAVYKKREAKDDSNARPLSNQWIRGGKLTEGIDERITMAVEDNVNNVTMRVLSATPISSVTLLSPNGKVVEPALKHSILEEGVYQGAYQYTISIDEPKSGEWELTLSSEDKNGYLLVANFHSAQKLVESESTKNKITNSNTWNYWLHANNVVLEEKSLQATYRITKSGQPDTMQTFTKKGTTDLSKELPVKDKGSVYNITIDVEGKTKQGKPFNRTIIDSIYVE